MITWGNRVALAIVFFWFGILKIIHLSPAEELVTHLYRITIANFVSIGTFMWMLGFIECMIGILWLIPKATKFVFIIFMFQIATTFMPLFFLKTETWQHSFALTLTGQYIIKNLVLVASASTVLLSRYAKSK
ncbi:MAG: hypothetical protein JJE22_19575 [Bacteroidia bacterium]|nr:hypothetical protein [Bacteroidia bacterium]